MLLNLTKTKSFSIVLFLLFVSLLSGCSAITSLPSTVSEKLFGREDPDAPDELQAINATKTASILWQTNIGEAGNFEFSPKVEAGFVYAASAVGDLFKLDSVTGEKLWSVNVGEPISGGVGAGGSLVLVGTQRGAVYAYDLDGNVKWKSKLSSEVLSVPVYFDGIVIVRTGDSKIYGINADDGSRKWVYDRTGPSLTLRSSAGVVVDGGAVYAGFAGGRLVAVRADNGKLLWEASVAQPKGVTEIERISDITSLPVIDGALIYAVAYQGRVAAVDRRTGRIAWNRAISSLNGMAVQDSRIYISHASGSVYSLDDQKGKSYWRQGSLLRRQLTMPLPMEAAIAVGDVEGYIHYLNIDDGAIDARVRLGESQIMPIMSLVDDATLVAQSRDGVVYAVKIN